MMFRARGKKGVVLLIVLGMVLVVAILAQAILSIILSHSRFTHHQTSRIQAYYAAMAGINYALERLRTGSWIVGINCTDLSPCDINDPDFPNTINSFDPVNRPNNREFRVIIYPPSATLGDPCFNPPGNSACVNITTNYLYTNP